MKKMCLAIVGVGVAGQVRLRDAAMFPNLTIAGIVSRRVGVGTLSFTDVINDPNIDGVIICTENATHYEYAHVALSHGKHVLLEFPVARTLAETNDLLVLAAKNKCLLQVEHISLLSEHHIWYRQQLVAQPISRVVFEVCGDYKSWLKADADLGLLGNVSVGRLMTLSDLLGPLRIVKINTQKFADGFYLACDLSSDLYPHTAVTLIHERKIGMKRSHELRLYQDETVLLPPLTLNNTKGLFAKDLQLFLAGTPYVTPLMLQNVMALAETIDQH